MIGGRYSLDREIGRGGSGPVWLGHDEVLGRQVALKRIGLLPGADKTDLARAEREARLSARLHHPHVVSVFDVVVDEENDARWLVMEYVDGVDLGRLVQERGPLSPADASPLLRQAADALLAAHQAGIVHRDVKPSNILLDRSGQVKLTDFGIARVTTDPSLTQTGLVTGSPAYLPPEVAQGTRGEAPADVWALGATAYYLLAGRAPYDAGENVLGTVVRIVNEEPPRLPGAGRLAGLLEGTMVKDPAQRWSMEQVRDFLDRGGEASSPDATRVLPVAPAPAPAADPARPAAAAKERQSTNRPLLLGVGAVVAVIALAVLAALLFRGDKPDRATTSTSSPSPSSTPSSTEATPQPTAQGMKAFIRDYVSTVSEDPDQAWTMLTPKFQRESGGLEKYRKFWEPATNGRVLSISADPKSLTVSYQVHFDNFDNGPGPTILDLEFQDGQYRIDGERTAGFTPAG